MNLKIVHKIVFNIFTPKSHSHTKWQNCFLDFGVWKVMTKLCTIRAKCVEFQRPQLHTRRPQLTVVYTIQFTLNTLRNLSWTKLFNLIKTKQIVATNCLVDFLCMAKTYYKCIEGYGTLVPGTCLMEQIGMIDGSSTNTEWITNSLNIRLFLIIGSVFNDRPGIHISVANTLWYKLLALACVNANLAVLSMQVPGTIFNLVTDNVSWRNCESEYEVNTDMSRLVISCWHFTGMCPALNFFVIKKCTVLM